MSLRSTLAACALALAPSAASAVDLQIVQTGRLLDLSDAPVNAPEGLPFAFKLFVSAVPAGAEEVAEWSESYTVPVHGSLYSVTLGGTLQGKKPLPSSAFAGSQPRFLEVSVDGRTLLPRLRVGVVPVAAVAQDVSCAGCVKEAALGEGAVTGAKVKDGSLVLADLAPEVGAAFATASHSHEGTYLPLSASLTCPEGQKMTGLDASGAVVCAIDAGYSDDLARAAMGPKASENPLHHDRYTSAEAVAAVAAAHGAKANDNARHHDRYSNAEAVAAVAAAHGVKANDNARHHDRYTNAEARVAARGNLLSNSSFSSNAGWVDEPERVLDVVPDGREAYVHRSVESGTSCYNWAVSERFPVDPASSYEFSVWVRATEGDLSNYFGFYVFDASGTAIQGAWNNPYFKTNNGDGPQYRRWSGYLLPTASTDANADGVADRQSARTTGTDWRMPPNAAFALIRFGACYGNGSNSGNAFFAAPSVREIDPDDGMISGL